MQLESSMIRSFFYQFKNPRDIDKSIKAGDIDNMISGLELIINRNHSNIANQELMSRLAEIYTFTPSGYKIVIAISSLSGIPPDVKTKLDNFCQRNSGASKDLFSWDFYNLESIHSDFYREHLPTLDANLEIPLTRQPYMSKVGGHETYIFDLTGDYLAKLYDAHKEKILQQNVRMFEGSKGTNLAIAKTASNAEEAKDFFHFNNGITIICDSAIYKLFNNELTLERP